MSANIFHRKTQKPCKKCGGCSTHALTIPRTADNDAYEVYQCTECNYVDWILQNQWSKQPAPRGIVSS